MKKCPECEGALEVVDVPLGFGNPSLYLCVNGHKVQGGERVYQTFDKWTQCPLRVVKVWCRWDEELTKEFIKAK